MNKQHLVAATFAAALAAHPLAQASTQAHASMSDLQYTLIDLDPNDGVTPWIHMLSPNAMDTNVSMWVEDEHGQSTYVLTPPDDAFGSVDVSRSLGNVSAEGHIVGHGEAAGTGVSVAAHVQSEYDAPRHGVATPYSALSWDFELSPNTQVVLTSSLHVDLQATVGHGRASYENGYAIAGLFLRAHGTFETMSDSEALQFYSQALPPGQGIDISKDRMLTVTATNRDALAGQYIFKQTSSIILETVTVVPEPSSLALLALGLPGLLIRARRTRLAA